MTKVLDQLGNLQKEGIIRRVEEPKALSSGMAGVPRLNGEVRACVDLPKLRKSIEREKLSLPSVKQTL